MTHSKKDQNKIAIITEEQLVGNITNKKGGQENEIKAQNDGFRYDYDDSSDV